MNKLQRFMQTKKGFTLVELVVVIALLGILVAIAVPTYNAIQKENRIKICKVKADKIESDVRIWAMQYPYNEDWSFEIESDGEQGSLSNVTTTSSIDYAKYNYDSINTYITEKIFKCDEADIPCCPASNGKFTVILTYNPNKTYCDVEVICNGGDDGDCHK